MILSEDVFNARSGTVIAVALTSQEPKAGFPLTLEIIGSGFPKRSWVKISQIRTLSVQRLRNKLGEATAEEVSSVLEGFERDIGSVEANVCSWALDRHSQMRRRCEFKREYYVEMSSLRRDDREYVRRLLEVWNG